MEHVMECIVADELLVVQYVVKYRYWVKCWMVRDTWSNVVYWAIDWSKYQATLQTSAIYFSPLSSILISRNSLAVKRSKDQWMNVILKLQWQTVWTSCKSGGQFLFTFSDKRGPGFSSTPLFCLGTKQLCCPKCHFSSIQITSFVKIENSCHFDEIWTKFAFCHFGI